MRSSAVSRELQSDMPLVSNERRPSAEQQYPYGEIKARHRYMDGGKVMAERGSVLRDSPAAITLLLYADG